MVATGSATEPGSLFVRSYAAPDGEVYSSLSLSIDAVEAQQTPHDHVILVDTSASQAGEHRTQSFAVLRELLQGLPATDRVAVQAIDISSAAMTDGMVSPAAASAQALPRLESRFPAGATDLASALELAMQSFEGDRAKSIIYIGDGMSAADLIETEQFRSLTTRLRDAHIPVHSFAVGPSIDGQTVGVLAHQTGGRAFIDNYRVEGEVLAAHIGADLAKAATAPVIYPSQLNSDVALIPATPLPLRADRTTVYLAKGATEGADLDLTAGGEQLHWNIPVAASKTGNTFLMHQYNAAASNEGLSNALAGDELIAAAQQGFEDSVTQLENKGRVATNRGDLKAASEIGFAIRSIDPENVVAVAFIDAEAETEIVQVGADDAAAVADDTADTTDAAADTTDATVDSDPALEGRDDAPVLGPLAAESARRAARSAQLRLQLDQAKEASNQAVKLDAVQAMEILDEMRGALKAATDIDAEDRDKMLRDLSAFRQVMSSKAAVQRTRELALAEEQRRAEAISELIEHADLLDARMEQLVDRVRGLMLEFDEGNDDAALNAEDVGRQISNLSPGNPLGMATTTVAEAAWQLRQAERLRSLRADKFLQTLYSVEKSHVPFPDDLAVVYPDPVFWERITRDRKKWNSVDLHKNNPNEQRIYEMLDTTVELEFIGTELGTAIKHIADTYQIAIIPDTTEIENIGVDLETDTVDLVIAGVTLRSALKLMLERLELTYIIEDEVMKITSRDYAANALQTRVYPVADLVIPVQPIIPSIGGGLNGQQGQQQNGFGGGQQGGFGGGQGFGGQGGQGGFFSIPSEAVRIEIPAKANTIFPKKKP